MLPKATAGDTRKRLLEAGERLFAEKGYYGTTLREITRAAQVNLASVNYHHGNLAGLYLEILRTRLRSLNEERLRRLAAAEPEPESSRIPLPAILLALAGPPLELGETENGRHTQKLLGRCLSEPLAFSAGVLAEEFEPTMSRFAQALRRHAMTMAPDEFVWRINFLVGSLHHTLSTLDQMHARTRGLCRDHDHSTALKGFVSLGVSVFK